MLKKAQPIDSFWLSGRRNERMAVRRLFIFAALVFPLIGVFFTRVQPNLIDPIGLRLLISGLFLVGVAFTFKDMPRRHIWHVDLTVLLIAILVHTGYLLHLNKGALPYQLGLVYSGIFLIMVSMRVYQVILVLALVWLFAVEIGFEFSQRDLSQLYIGLGLLSVVSPVLWLVERSLRKDLVDVGSSLFKRSPGPSLIVNDQGHIVAVSDEIPNLLGYEKSELVGQNVKLLVPPEVKGRHDGLVSKYFENPELFILDHAREIKVIAKSGDQIPVEVIINPILRGKEKLVYTVIRDIRERVRYEETILSQKSALEKTNRFAEIGLMAGGIAHEINTPLSTITICAELIERELNETDREVDLKEILSSVDLIHKSVNKTTETIRSLLVVSRKGEQEEVVEIDIIEAINEVITFASVRAKSKSIRFINKIPEEAVWVKVNPTHLSQIFLNLINNAIDAMDSIEESHEKVIEIEVISGKGKVGLQVRDFGPGIPNDIAQRIFNPFFTTKPVGQGTGLGLSIVKSLVEGNKGEISLIDVPQGAAFLVEFPILKDDQLFDSALSFES